MLSSFKKSPVEQETIGCYSIFQVGSLSKVEPKTSDEQGASEITTVEPDTEEHANEKIASKEEAGSSEASTEASRETASASEEEKTYTLSFESLCGDESLGSGSVSLKLSNDYITIESGEPHYPDCELVSTEVAGYTLSDGKLSGADDAKSVLDGGANVTFRFRSTKPEETAITLHAVARDTDGNEIRKLSDLSYTLKKDETKELSAPDAADFAAETDEEKITYTYLRTEVDGAERNTISTADDGKTVAFIYKKETAPKEITVTVHQTAKDTDGNVIADLDDATLTLKKGESRDLQVPGADTLPKDKKNVSYKYVRTEVNGKETNSVNGEQEESAAVFYYDKITAVTLKQEAVDTDGKRIEKLDDLKAELKGSEAKELKAPEAKKFDTEDAEQKITYTYEKTLVDGKEASKVTAADDGKTITYVYKKTAADKKTTVTLKQEAVDTEGNRIKKLDALTLELKKDEKKTLKAPDAKSLLNDRDSDVTYTFEKILVDGKEKDTVTAKDDGKTIQYVYKKEAVAKIIKTVHVVAVDDTEDHKKIADLGEKKLTFHGKDDAITLAKIQPDTDRFTKKDEDYSYEYVYSYAELNGEKTAKVTAEDLTKDNTLTFVYQVKKTELPVTRTVKLVIRDTDGNAIKTFARVGVAFESSKAKRTANSFESYAKDVEELKETEDCRYEFKEARLNGKVFEEISAKDVTAGDTLTLVYEKVDKKVAVKITATAVDENGKTIAGHAKKELPDFDHVLTLDDPEKAPLSIDGYAYVDAKIDNTVIASLKKEKVDGAEDEDDSFAWSYVADGKTVDIEEDTDITLEYQAQKAVALNVTYVDEFGDPIGEDYKDLTLDGDRFDEKNILKLEAGEDKPLQETIQVAQDESGKKIIQYTFEDAFIKVGLEKTEITAIQRTKISGSDENSNGAKYAYAVRYEGSDDFTDLDEDTTVYLQYNGGRKRLYTYEDDSVKVTAILQHADAIPDDAEFVVTPITKDSSDYNYAAYMQALNDNADKIQEGSNDITSEEESNDVESDRTEDLYRDDNTLLYDIAFMGHPVSEDGTIDQDKKIEYQPAEGYVNLSVEFKNHQLRDNLSTTDAENVGVIHLPLSETIKKTVDATKEAKNISSSEIQVEPTDASAILANGDTQTESDPDIVTFKAENFSLYAFTNQSNENDYSKVDWNRDFIKLDRPIIIGNNTSSLFYFDNSLTDNDYETLKSALNENLGSSETVQSHADVDAHIKLWYHYINDDSETFTHTKYYNPALALGIAGNFHIVAFDTATLGAHTNGNILAKNLYAGSNFGTNSKGNVSVSEVTYVANSYTQVSSISGSNPNTPLVVSSKTKIGFEDNGNAFSINGNKLSNPQIVYRDSVSKKFIDIDSVKSQIEGISAYLASKPSCDVTKKDNGEYQLDNPNGVGVLNLTAADVSKMPTDVHFTGFESGHNGSIIVNVDMADVSSVNLPERAYIYIDGQQQGTNEVVDFSAGKIIWNFTNASGKKITAKNMSGTIIAPDSNVELTQNINGTIIGNNVHNTAETHRSDFTGITVGDSKTFGVTKAFAEGSTWPDGSTYTFTFTPDDPRNTYTPVFSSVTLSKNHWKGEFGDINFPYIEGHDGKTIDYYYTVKEDCTNPVEGVTYDPTEYNVKIGVTYSNNLRN